MAPMPRKIDPELRSRAVLVTERRNEYNSATAVRVYVAECLGVSLESVRTWWPA